MAIAAELRRDEKVLCRCSPPPSHRTSACVARALAALSLGESRRVWRTPPAGSSRVIFVCSVQSGLVLLAHLFIWQGKLLIFFPFYGLGGGIRRVFVLHLVLVVLLVPGDND